MDRVERGIQELADPLAFIRKLAASNLLRYGDARAIPALRRAAESDADAEVRAEARKSLEGLRRAGSSTSEPSTPATPPSSTTLARSAPLGSPAVPSSGPLLTTPPVPGSSLSRPSSLESILGKPSSLDAILGKPSSLESILGPSRDIASIFGKPTPTPTPGAPAAGVPSAGPARPLASESPTTLARSAPLAAPPVAGTPAPATVPAPRPPPVTSAPRAPSTQVPSPHTPPAAPPPRAREPARPTPVPIAPSASLAGLVRVLETGQARERQRLVDTLAAILLLRRGGLEAKRAALPRPPVPPPERGRPEPKRPAASTQPLFTREPATPPPAPVRAPVVTPVAPPVVTAVTPPRPRPSGERKAARPSGERKAVAAGRPGPSVGVDGAPVRSESKKPTPWGFLGFLLLGFCVCPCTGLVWLGERGDARRRDTAAQWTREAEAERAADERRRVEAEAAAARARRQREETAERTRAAERERQDELRRQREAARAASAAARATAGSSAGSSTAGDARSSSTASSGGPGAGRDPASAGAGFETSGGGVALPPPTSPSTGKGGATSPEAGVAASSAASSGPGASAGASTAPPTPREMLAAKAVPAPPSAIQRLDPLPSAHLGNSTMSVTGIVRVDRGSVLVVALDESIATVTMRNVAADGNGRFRASVDGRKAEEGARRVVMRWFVDGTLVETTLPITVDRTPPRLVVPGLAPLAVTTESILSLAGQVEDAHPRDLTSPEGESPLPPDGRFELTLPLALGENRIDLRATDMAQGTTRVSGIVIRGAAVLPARTAPRTRKHAQDGADMVFVPAGRFVLGGGPAGRSVGPSYPAKVVSTAAFWIDRTPVTRAQYRRMAEETGRPFPPTSSARPKDRPPPTDDEAMTEVTWDEAAAYAAWAGKALPSEAQWEHAARGPDARRYPWGNDPPDALRGPFTDAAPLERSLRTPRVGAFPANASPYGMLDAVGVVEEWCRDRYDAAYYRSAPEVDPSGPAQGTLRSVRGLSYETATMNSTDTARVSQRRGADPAKRSLRVGFRCVAAE